MQPEGTIYCEYSAQVASAMRARGWDMWTVDFLPSESPHPQHACEDARDFVVGAARDAFAGVHWPCTYFALSGVRWLAPSGVLCGTVETRKRWFAMQESAEGLATLLRQLIDRGTPFYFENPRMHGHAKKAIAAVLPWFRSAVPQVIQPWNFGVWETKATCLWLHRLPPLALRYRTADECRRALGLPEFVTKNGRRVPNKPAPKVHFASPGPDRGKERSRTLPAYADEIARQWGDAIRKGTL